MEVWALSDVPYRRISGYSLVRRTLSWAEALNDVVSSNCLLIESQSLASLSFSFAFSSPVPSHFDVAFFLNFDFLHDSFPTETRINLLVSVG